MAKYAIAFVTPSKGTSLRHKLIEAETKDAALRRFFDEEAAEFYSNDEQGFFYFKEDFYDEISKSGSILES